MKIYKRVLNKERCNLGLPEDSFCFESLSNCVYCFSPDISYFKKKLQSRYCENIKMDWIGIFMGFISINPKKLFILCFLLRMTDDKFLSIRYL